jgi:large subunit ribosomal protein L24e
MRIEKCYFCLGSIYPGHGSMFVRNDGAVFRFCRSKCNRNFKHKRNPRRVAWTKTCRKVKGKDLVADSVFAFEKRRAEPLVYDRDRYARVVESIPKISAIRHAREAFYIKDRILSRTEGMKDAERVFIKKNVEILSEEERKARSRELKKQAIDASKELV